MQKKTIKKNIPAYNCPVTRAIEVIGGKWKSIIIHLVINDINRFGEMQKNLTGISKQMLTKQLRELEADGILNRKIYPVVPPRVEYSLTAQGKQAITVIRELGVFGKNLLK